LATTTSPHVQHYAKEAARVVQDLCKSCRVRRFILFYFSAKCQNSCTILVHEFYVILFYFIGNERTALPLFLQQVATC